MTSPSAVEIIAIKEAVYGQTPAFASANGGTVRKVSESLSGSPTTAESAELRSDRMSGGLVVTGLESGGSIDFELAKDTLFEEFFSGAMMNNWVNGFTLAAASTTLKKTVGNDQTATITITGDTGDFDGAGRALVAGDVVQLSGFTNAANNTPVQVVSVTDKTHFLAIVPRSTVDETAANGVVKLANYVDIGKSILSWTLSKAYTDVLHLATTDAHSQRYTGSLVNTMSVNIAYGEIVTGSFGFLSNGYDQEHPSLHQKVVAAGGTIAPASTSNAMNGSVDINLVSVAGAPTSFCIQSMSIELTNNATPQNCIGLLAPTRYNLGTAHINVSTSIYLGDASYDKFMPAKLNMAPVSMLFGAQNADGGYAFSMPAVQLSFPDPAQSGGDAPIMIEASGTAKVGANGASALRIWAW